MDLLTFLQIVFWILLGGCGASALWTISNDTLRRRIEYLEYKAQYCRCGHDFDAHGITRPCSICSDCKNYIDKEEIV